MATQSRLLTPSFHLDARSREAGRRGLVKARAALADAVARSNPRRPDGPDGPSGPGRSETSDTHATAA